MIFEKFDFSNTIRGKANIQEFDFCHATEFQPGAGKSIACKKNCANRPDKWLFVILTAPCEILHLI